MMSLIHFKMMMVRIKIIIIILNQSIMIQIIVS